MSLPVPVVQKLLGHRSMATTEIYINLAGQHLEAALPAMNVIAEEALGQVLGAKDKRDAANNEGCRE